MKTEAQQGVALAIFVLGWLVGLGSLVLMGIMVIGLVDYKIFWPWPFFPIGSAVITTTLAFFHLFVNDGKSIKETRRMMTTANYWCLMFYLVAHSGAIVGVVMLVAWIFSVYKWENKKNGGVA